MPEDTDLPNDPGDAPADPTQRLMPGQSMFGMNEEGLQVVTVTQPQVLSIKADKETVRQIIVDWLTKHDEEFWELLVKSRLEVLRQRQKSALQVVTDPATVRHVTRGKRAQA